MDAGRQSGWLMETKPETHTMNLVDTDKIQQASASNQETTSSLQVAQGFVCCGPICTRHDQLHMEVSRHICLKVEEFSLITLKRIPYTLAYIVHAVVLHAPHMGQTGQMQCTM